MAGSKQEWNGELKGLRGLAMCSHRSTPGLLMMALLAVPLGGAHSQPISTSAGAVVEVTVVPLRNGKPPQEVQCVEKVKVVKGTASIETFTGKRRELHENEEVCITPTGELTVSTAAVEQGGGPPSGGGTTPPCVTACNGNSGIQIR
jgi:hypothetical protein